MSFTESYKQLEKLCGEIMNDDRRVSAYRTGGLPGRKCSWNSK